MPNPSPLPFPELPDELARLMARQPDAPHTVRGLWERLPANQYPGVTMDDVKQCLMRLERMGQAFTDTNALSGLDFWKLTTRGKLNQGIS